MLFRGSKTECETLVEWLRSLMPNVVKFKFEFSYEKIEFLDLEIRIEDGILKTNLYTKPTNKQLYLDYNSNHPGHCKDSIPYSQALRVVERCSTQEDRYAQLISLQTKFEGRNCPPELVKDKFEKAKKNRKSLIFNTERTNIVTKTVIKSD